MLTPSQEETREQFITTEVNHKYYDAGIQAKKKGFAKINPYYGKHSSTKEYFWMCGYDGVKFEDALSTFRDKMKELEFSEPSGNGTQSTNGLTSK